ncbi:MAG: hypothetical protein JF593_12905 [Novosphingobium sp.]|nr:hypothetical protein [Novosphingobium sp.]
MPRTIVATDRHRSEQIAPGVFLEEFYPGGKDGPNAVVLSDYPGGQVWSETVMLGDESSSFIAAIPDIRLPANQIWPLHWHDCWVGILIVEGTCLIGDWWMKPGDVLITQESLEYGPLLIGPTGCRMFEIFAKLHLQSGGYAKEYHDHPTLQGGSMAFNFTERKGVNTRNDGNQCLPLVGIEGFTKGSLVPGSLWDLGSGGDPERSVLKVERLAPGERIAPHSRKDWYAVVVFEGSLEVAGRTLGRDQFLRIAPDSAVPEITAGADGALVLELARTAVATDRVPAQQNVAEGIA